MSFETDTASTLGAHGARLTNVEGNIAEIKGDVKKILAALTTEKGATAEKRRTWAGAAGLVGLAAGLTEVIEFFKHMGKH